MKTKHRLAGYIILGLFVASMVVLSFLLPEFKKFASPLFVRDYLLNSGPWGYAIFIFLMVLSIPLPIPSTPLALGGGYVYGTFGGTTLSMIATVLGATISFYLIRIFGQPLLEKLVHKLHIIHFNHIFQKRGVSAAIISYAIPVFPSDALDLMLGFSKISYLTFLFIVILGNIPRYLIVNALGQELYTGFTIKTVILLLISITFVLIALFREKIKKIMFKELRYLEKEVEKEAELVEEEVGLKKKKRKLKK